MIHGSINDLEGLLRLEPLSSDDSSTRAFAAPNVPDSRARVYGGQFLGQGLIAASRVRRGPIRSFHCYYIRAGSTDAPITYVVRVAGADLLFVQAIQDEKILFSMDVACGGFANAPNVAMPAVASPEQCISRSDGIRGLNSDTDSTWAVTDSPFDYRFVENIWSPEYAAAGHNVWFRARDPDDVDPSAPQSLAQAMTAYFADDPIMDNALFPHGWHRSWTELQTASLDHAMWFHAPVDLRQWMLFVQDSPVAAGGRAITRGLMFNPDGELIATACQEILMRTAQKAST
ncbi:MAG: thioesterase family protein [Gammaproteobacteria bacterium]|nr:thioesterase family protein [Gammaproteobacteria bacterium]